jgi:ribonuclease HI
MKYLIYADGACPRNGRRGARAQGSFAAYRLKDNEAYSNALHERLAGMLPMHHESRFDIVPAVYDGHPGQVTNNMAEAQSLCTAIVWACSNGLFDCDNEIHICMDSKLILSQFLGVYKTKEPHLMAVYRRIYDILGQQSKKLGCDAEKLVHLHWISGEVMKRSVIAH